MDEGEMYANDRVLFLQKVLFLARIIVILVVLL